MQRRFTVSDKRTTAAISTPQVYRIKDKNTGERYALKMMDASKVCDVSLCEPWGAVACTVRHSDFSR